MFKIWSVFLVLIYFNVAMSLETKTKVFIYGTLKHCEPNGNVVTNATGSHEFIDFATTVDKYPLFVATKHNIPFLINEKGQGFRVKGELYEVDYVKLQLLNDFEDYPNWYNLIDIDVTDTNGVVHTAKIYLLDTFDAKLASTMTKYLTEYTNGIEGRFYLVPPAGLYS